MQPYPHQYPPHAAAPAAKSGGSKWWMWLLGGIGCFGLLGVGAVVVLFGGLFAIGSAVEDSPAGVSPTQAEPVAATDLPQAGQVRFVNQKDKLSGGFSENFVPFSFEFPAQWRQTKTTTNFVTVGRDVVTSKSESGGTTFKTKASAEKLSIGYWTDPTFDLKQLLPAGAKVVSEGPVTVAGYKGREVRSASKGLGGDVWVRLILLRDTPDAKRGLIIIMLATNLAKGVTGPKDLGDSGGFGVALKSIKIGKDAKTRGVAGDCRYASSDGCLDCYSSCCGSTSGLFTSTAGCICK